MKKGWNEVKLEEIAEVVGGGTPSSKEDSYWNGDINWVTPADLSGYMFKHISNGDRKITKLGLSKSSAKLHPKGTVLMTSRAPIGYLAIAGDEVATNQGFQSLRCKTDKVDNNFIYYILHLYKEGIQAIASGATFPEVSGKKVKGFKIKIPPLKTQRKIASILSAYDDLIENNLKRIKLLEEKAQLTYEEWFVRMKFPGHETTPINNETGLPAGWEKKTLKELSIKITKGTTPTSLKKQFKEQGINFVKAESYSDEGFFKPQKFAYIDEETHDLLNRSKLEKHDVIVSIAGVLGRVAIINSDILPANTNQAVGIVRLKQNQVSPHYIKYFLSSEYMNKLINIISGQAAQPNINLTQLGSFKVPLPKKETIRLFHEIVDLIHQSQTLLSKQNQLLKEARDILLPRLMTGIIDVDQIELENLQPTNA